jgi:hypothetical protein
MCGLGLETLTSWICDGGVQNADDRFNTWLRQTAWVAPPRSPHGLFSVLWVWVRYQRMVTLLTVRSIGHLLEFIHFHRGILP